MTFKDFLMTFLYFLHDFLMTFSWHSYDFLMIFSWLSHDFLMTLSWISHDWHILLNKNQIPYFGQTEVKLKLKLPKGLCIFIIWLALFFSSNNVPQSNVLSTVIFNFDYDFFFAFIAILLKFNCHTESVQQKEKLNWSQKRSKNTLFVTNQWFLCCTDSVRRTSSKEMAKNAKKGDIVKIENHCNKKIRLVYLKWYSYRLPSQQQMSYISNSLLFLLLKVEHLKDEIFAPH